MPENNNTDPVALTDTLDDLTEEHTEALFELVAELDPLAFEDGAAKYTPKQQAVIGAMQKAYRDAGYTND